MMYDRPYTKIAEIFPIGQKNMATRAELSLTLYPMGKHILIISSKTTEADQTN